MGQTAENFGTSNSQIRRIVALFRQSVSAHGIFWLTISVYYFCYLILHLVRPDIVRSNVLAGSLHVLTRASADIFLCFFVVLVAWFAIWVYRVMYLTKPEQLIAALSNYIRQSLTVFIKRLANGLPMLLVVVCVIFITTDIQGKILTLNPSTWDVYFADLDQFIHFGNQPWQLLQPIFGHPPITFLLNLNYNIWFSVMWVSFIYFGFMSRPSELRTRFFLTFVVTWIIVGNLLATVFSTGGPCYFSRLGLSPDPFTGLMEYLRHANTIYPIWAVNTQDILWKGHVNDVPLSLISAMPSLHNAAAMVFALAAYQVNRFWGRVLTVHAAFIFIGSIHLAWHYAVDSYLSWVVVLAIWFAMGHIARWWHSNTAQSNFDAMLAA